MNQYREGKVKSTPTRGVKQFLKPNAYKQWERARRRRAAQVPGARNEDLGKTNRSVRAAELAVWVWVCSSWLPVPGSWFLKGSPSVSP